MNQTINRMDAAAEIDFVVRRAANITDAERDTLARILFERPFSEVRRLFNAAVEAAMPATLTALRRVAEEFEGRQPCHLAAPVRDDEDIETIFRDDLIG